jgi:hypothetical protein
VSWNRALCSRVYAWYMSRLQVILSPLTLREIRVVCKASLETRSCWFCTPHWFIYRIYKCNISWFTETAPTCLLLPSFTNVTKYKPTKWRHIPVLVKIGLKWPILYTKITFVAVWCLEHNSSNTGAKNDSNNSCRKAWSTRIRCPVCVTHSDN